MEKKCAGRWDTRSRTRPEKRSKTLEVFEDQVKKRVGSNQRTENVVTVGSRISDVSLPSPQHPAVSDYLSCAPVSLPPHHAHRAQQEEKNPNLSVFKYPPS